MGKSLECNCCWRLNKRRNRNIAWKVFYEYGNYAEATTVHLTSGAKQSCGCLEHPIEDLTGHKKNKLTIKNMANFRSGKGEFL